MCINFLPPDGWFDPKQTLDSSGIHVHKTNGPEREREREREGSCGDSKWLTFGEAGGRTEDLLSVLIERELLDWEATQSCLQRLGHGPQR